ncbi:MAG: tRNA lysidine(34) synthetase TilS [Centipeda sp. (in: firmicutes)]|mgnify:FL=1
MRITKGTPCGVLFLYQEQILQKHVERVLRAQGFFSPACTLIVACSGGTDSLALLDVLERLRAAGGAELVCAHYEHGIRGADSIADAHFVEEFCAARAISCVCAAGDVPVYARKHRLSIEAAARICRYDFLHRVRAERGGDAIVLAHHADDLAETVLLRILRGTGPAGLAAMRVWDGLHLRPLLSVKRMQIEEYAAERGLSPRHDATNDAMDARRNRVRRALLPALAHDYNPAVREALTRLSTLAAEEDAYLAKLAEDAYVRAVCPEGLALAVLRDLHPAMQRRVLRLFWTRETGMAQDFSYLHEERLRALITAKGTARTEMPGGWHAAARYGVLALVCTPMAQRSAEKSEILLPLGDEYVIINFQGMTFHVRCLTHMTADDWRRMERREAVYADLAQMPPLVLRTRRAGDYIQLPIGRRKIKDVFIDDKIPREDRDNIPLVAAAGTHEIFWMVGGRRSVRAPVTASSSDILSIAFVKETIAR